MQYEIIPVTHYQQNCCLVWCDDTRQAAVIDPGGNVELICKKIATTKVSVSKILLTHGHLDHAGGVHELKEKLQVPVIGPHKDDAFWLQAMDQQAAMMGFAAVPPLLPDQWLEHGNRITIGNQTIEVLHCPGHTPGHIVFFHRQSQLAWVGDVLFAGSIGRTDFPRGDYETLIRSIRERLFPLGPDVRFIPGHGPMSTLGKEQQDNPFVADTRFG